jgi:hypothetical protein
MNKIAILHFSIQNALCDRLPPHFLLMHFVTPANEIGLTREGVSPILLGDLVEIIRRSQL